MTTSGSSLWIPAPRLREDKFRGNDKSVVVWRENHLIRRI